jgi:H+/Cl- antiporter ClcA
MAEADATSAGSGPSVPPKRFLLLLVLASVVGLVVSLAAWGFLQLIHYIPEWVYDDLPQAFGYDDGAPQWWPLPVCAFAGLVTAFAIVRLPGRGGHVPAHGLNPSPTQPVDLPGVMLAAIARLILFKGLVYSISLAGFRGGPVFPSLYLGAAAGLMASHLAGFDQTAAVAVGIGAATVAILKLPMSAAALATVLTAESGAGAMPLVIVGVVTAYLLTRVLSARLDAGAETVAPGQEPAVAHA